GRRSARTKRNEAPRQRFVRISRERHRNRLERLAGERLRGIFLLRHVPFVAALEALAIFSARLRELHLSTELAALRTLLGDGLVPHDEVAAVVRAGVERRAALARAALHELTAILRAEHARRHRPR